MSLSPKKVTFSLRDESWYASRTNMSAGLCMSGVRSYIDLPVGASKFAVIFTEDEVPGKSTQFPIGYNSDQQITVLAGSHIDFLAEAMDLLRSLYEKGYRFVHVEEKEAPKLNDKILTFRRSTDSADWRAVPGSAGRAHVCAGGLEEYVVLPVGTYEFDARFSQEQPTGNDFFELRDPELGGGLVVESRISLYDNAAELLTRLYRRGYRYLSVEY